MCMLLINVPLKCQSVKQKIYGSFWLVFQTKLQVYVAACQMVYGPCLAQHLSYHLHQAEKYYTIYNSKNVPASNQQRPQIIVNNIWQRSSPFHLSSDVCFLDEPGLASNPQFSSCTFLNQNLWRKMTLVFTGQMSFPSPNEQCQRKQFKVQNILWKIICLARPFFVHHQIRDRKDYAPFALALQHVLLTCEIKHNRYITSHQEVLQYRDAITANHY